VNQFVIETVDKENPLCWKLGTVNDDGSLVIAGESIGSAAAFERDGALFHDFHQYVFDMTYAWVDRHIRYPVYQSCFWFAAKGATVIHRITGARAIVQAGLAAWQVNDNKTENTFCYDGEINPVTGFSDVHAWIAIAEQGLIIDLTTGLQREHYRRHGDGRLRWDIDLPDFIWGFDESKHGGMVYLPSAEAIDAVLEMYFDPDANTAFNPGCEHQLDVLLGDLKEVYRD
jgi:hypothetical protein